MYRRGSSKLAHATESALPFSPPTLVRKTEPEYTAEARSQRFEGVTTLSVEITKDGVATVVKVVRSLDPGLMPEPFRPSNDGGSGRA